MNFQEAAGILAKTPGIADGFFGWVVIELAGIIQSGEFVDSYQRDIEDELEFVCDMSYFDKVLLTLAAKVYNELIALKKEIDNQSVERGKFAMDDLRMEFSKTENKFNTAMLLFWHNVFNRLSKAKKLTPGSYISQSGFRVMRLQKKTMDYDRKGMPKLVAISFNSAEGLELLFE